MMKVTDDMLLRELRSLDASAKNLVRRTSELVAYLRETNSILAEGWKRIEETKIRLPKTTLRLIVGTWMPWLKSRTS